MGGFDHGFRADLDAEPHRHGVERHGQRLGQRHRSEILMRVILRLPASHIDRRILAHGRGGEAFFHRGEVDERLEGRARLTLRRDRAIELALGVIAAADQRLDRAVRVHRDERALADAEFRALLIELLGQRLFRIRLQRRAHRRRHHNILVDRADGIVENVHHIVGGVVDGARAAAHGLRRMGEGELAHGVGDEAFLASSPR